MLGICFSHLYPITLLSLIVGKGQIATFGKNLSQVHLIIIREWAKKSW